MLNKAIALLLLTGSISAAAQDDNGEIITLESTVVGSQEQPTVLYIIPWKPASSLEKVESTLPQAISHAFRHQEYSELQREIKLLTPNKETN